MRERFVFAVSLPCILGNYFENRKDGTPLSYEMANEIRGYHVWRDVRITTCNLLITDLELSSEDDTFAVVIQKLDKLTVLIRL